MDNGSLAEAGRFPEFDEVVSIGNGLLADIDSLAERGTAALVASLPDLGKEGIRTLVLKNSRVNIIHFLKTLLHRVSPEDLVVPHALIELTREFYRRGLPMKDLLRAYHVSFKFNLGLWSQAVLEKGLEAEAGFRVVNYVMSYQISTLDLLTDAVVREYRIEETRLAQQWSRARLETVRRILDDKEARDDKAELLSRQLGYQLRGSHTAVIVHAPAGPGDTGADLEQSMHNLPKSLTQGLSLFVDIRTIWCWVADADLDRLEPQEGVLIAVGRPAKGLAGFAKSHYEATEALRVAQQFREPPAVLRYADAELAALCSVDSDRCRAFIAECLGDLANDDEHHQRLRETVRTYLSEGSLRGAAGILHLHHNTVRYRLGQAERMLGYEIDSRKLPLQLALHLLWVFTESH